MNTVGGGGGGGASAPQPTSAHFSALTGHQTLSSATEEKEASEGRKTSLTEPEEAVCFFFAIKVAFEMKRTPEFPMNVTWFKCKYL